MYENIFVKILDSGPYKFGMCGGGCCRCNCCILYEYRDADIIMIIGSLVYIGSASYVQSKTICILDYVEVSNNQFTQYSFSGKRKRAVNSDEPIYYQIVPLFEGFFLRADFIVLSNQEFLPYRNGSVIGTVYKEAMAKGNQIIMPYNQKSRPLLHLRDWHKVIDL